MMRIAGVMLLACLVPAQVMAAGSPQDRIDFSPVIGNPIPLDVPLTDETGAEARLVDYLAGRPLILVPAWYRCENLCSLTLSGLAAGLDAAGLGQGAGYDVMVFSIAPEEGPADARAARRMLAEQAPAAAAWRFATGGADAVRSLAAAIGFEYFYDDQRGQYAHAAGFVILDAGGRLTHFFSGVRYAPRDLKLAVAEAARGRTGSLTGRLLLYCFDYDPATGRYSVRILQLLKIACLLTALLLGLTGGVWLYREKRGAPDV